jgi:hypothetical protein
MRLYKVSSKVATIVRKRFYPKMLKWQKVSDQEKKIKKVQICQNAPTPLMYTDYGGSWSFFTRFLAKILYLIQLLLTTHPIESLNSLNRAQISGK